MISLKPYHSPMPVGVRLPKIEIEKKYYDMLSISHNSSNYDFLRHLCLRGVKQKGIDKMESAQKYYDRVKTELQVLKELDFIDYILLNWDILNFCHINKIPTGPGRGSAAGSLVLYLIGVTNVDPIKYELFFERFVSKSRAKKTVVDGVVYLDGSLLCDVDNDISYDRRQEVIEYIEKKHSGKTCKILTLNTLSSKLCIKECGKIVGEMSEQEVNDISSSIPKQFGKVYKLDKAVEESDKFREFAKKHQKVFQIAKKLEGLNKNTGVHPSGIAISFYNIEEVMPMQCTNEGAMVSGYDMNDVASLMVKFDILGLRTLSVIHDCCNQLGIDMEKIDVNDPSVFAALQNLNTPKGLFQIEAETNFKVCKKVRPKNLEELSAVVAIARPGALDYLDVYATYTDSGQFQSVHEFFDDILSYTGGIPLYQEQLMKMVVKVGFTLDESEQLRRIVGKKKVDQMPIWKSKIENKIKEQGLDPKIADVLWKVAEDSANYSFNKSHSISYAILASMTAYLKFKYPQNFFLSLLKMSQHEPDAFAEISLINQELSFFNIKLLPPSLSKSKLDFFIEDKDIRYGLNGIKGVSSHTLDNIVQFRDAQNSSQNKYDIFLTAKQAGVNIGVLSGLIQGGTMDSFCNYTDGIPDRSRLVLEAQAFNLLTDREKRNFVILGSRHNYDILNSIKSCVQEATVGDDERPIMSAKRFKTFKQKYDEYKSIYEKNKQHLKFANWYFERKYLGYSYTHELKSVFENSDKLYNSKELALLPEKCSVKFVGVVVDVVASRTSSNGNRYMRLELQDDFGNINFLLINSARTDSYNQYFDSGGQKPKEGEIVFATGSKGDGVIFGQRLSILDEKIYTKLSEIK
jgi:DNA polymerase-3 subunit alpha